MSQHLKLNKSTALHDILPQLLQTEFTIMEIKKTHQIHKFINQLNHLQMNCLIVLFHIVLQ